MSGFGAPGWVELKSSSSSARLRPVMSAGPLAQGAYGAPPRSALGEGAAARRAAQDAAHVCRRLSI